MTSGVAGCAELGGVLDVWLGDARCVWSEFAPCVELGGTGRVVDGGGRCHVLSVAFVPCCALGGEGRRTPVVALQLSLDSPGHFVLCVACVYQRLDFAGLFFPED